VSVVSVRRSSGFSLELFNLSLVGSRPFTISDSDVSIVVIGVNSVSAESFQSAGIECAENSSLTFWSRSNGTLTVSGGEDGAGIGTGLNGICRRIEFVNGSRGAGIGCGGAVSGRSEVGDLVLRDGDFTASGRWSSAIGTGYCESGRSRIGAIAIVRANVFASGDRIRVVCDGRR
jgi:hypothetical protein